jgi:hypothetical protein
MTVCCASVKKQDGVRASSRLSLYRPNQLHESMLSTRVDSRNARRDLRLKAVKRRWQLRLSLLLLCGLLLLPQVRWPVYGWLRGEAAYQGMPVSWWAREIEESYHPSYFGKLLLDEPCPRPTDWEVTRPASLWDQLQQRLRPETTAMPVSDSIIGGGPLLDGDSTALPVLLSLIRNQSAKVRRVSIAGLLAQGKPQPEVVAALLEAMTDPDAAVRRDAMTALQRLDPEVAAKAGVK